MTIQYYIFAVIIMISTNCICMKAERQYWKNHAYLQSKPFQKRQQKAVELVKDYPLIIEIGGGLSPISKSKILPKTTQVTVIDPFIKNGTSTNTTFIRKKFQDWDGKNSLQNKQYAVVILGLELDMPQNGWNDLYDLINQSEKTVIEYSTSFKKAKRQLKDILNNTTKKPSQEIEFDLSKECRGNQYKTAYLYRKMLLLENQEIAKK